MKHINTGAKAAAGMHSPSWRMWLFDASGCRFTYPTIRGNHYSFVPKIHAVML